MRWRVLLLCLLTWNFGIPCPPAHAASPTNQQLYLNIYLKINEAEHFERDGDYRRALDDFTDCYDQLSKLHHDDPDWESVLVLRRMDDCKSKIAELTPKAEAQTEATPTPSPTPPTSTPDTTTAAPTPTPEPSAPSQDLTALQQKLDAATKELSDTKQQLADISAKYQNSQLEVQSLHTQLDGVNQQLAALKTQENVDDRVGKLMDENKALTDKLTDAQQQIDAVKSPKTLTLLRTQLKNAQDQLAESQAANTALQETTTTLKQQVDQLQTNLTDANQKLANAPTNNPDYQTIKHENEIMRGILTREIQEQSRRDGAKRLAQEEFDRLKLTSKVLQEQLDILGSPMTPPTSDEERSILASLKTSGPDLAPVPPPSNDNGATFSAPNTATNAPPVTSNPATPDTTIVTPNPSPTPDMTSTTPTPTPTPDTSNSTPPATASTPAPDTNAPSASVTPTPTPSPAPADTTTTTAAPSPAPTDTTATPSATTNTAPTQSVIPPGTTTYTDTTIQNNPPPSPSDPTQYSTKPRLPDDMRDTAQQAADLFKMQRYDEAAAKYQSIIDKYPESLYAWSNLGVVRFQQGSLPEALKALQQAVKLSPTDAFSYRDLGIVYFQMNQYESAIDALERSIALEPNNAKSHIYLGCAESQKGWQEQAEKNFRKAIDIDETDGEAHFNLAVIYATSKPPSLELARRHYNRALELGIPKDPKLEKLLAQ